MLRTMASIVGLAPLIGLGLMAGTAVAGWNERVPPVDDPLTAKECGECHMAYQPALLPAASWHRIMTNLTDHFGDNASLPKDTAAAIEAWLVARAGRGDETLDRITEQRWFTREHRFSRNDLARSKAKSPAQCDACHRDAARGYYEDD